MLARGGCPMAAQTSKPSHSSEDSVIQIHGVLGGNKNSVMAKVRYTTSKSTPKNHAERPLLVTRNAVRVCPGTSSGITKFSEHEAD